MSWLNLTHQYSRGKISSLRPHAACAWQLLKAKATPIRETPRLVRETQWWLLRSKLMTLVVSLANLPNWKSAGRRRSIVISVWRVKIFWWGQLSSRPKLPIKTTIGSNTTLLFEQDSSTWEQKKTLFKSSWSHRSTSSIIIYFWYATPLRSLVSIPT